MIAGLVFISASCSRTRSPSNPSTTDHHQGVAAHSMEVMPFDVNSTTHRFEPTQRGLIETVVTTTRDDPHQVALIQEHLQHEAKLFNAGNWDDPAKIHGDDMPGLAELRAHPTAVTVTYSPVQGGATLTYTTNGQMLIDALHNWGRAQSADHDHTRSP